MRAEDLLIGPRGRDLCWGLTAPDAEFSVAGALAALADAVTLAVYWQEPLAHHLVRPGVELRPVAERLAAGDATDGWAAPITLDDQHVVVLEPAGYPAETPRLAGLRARLDAEHAPGSWELEADERVDWRTVSAAWWSAPITPYGVHTTGAANGVPLGLSLVEDDPCADRGRTWPVRTTRPPRVLELTGPDEWVALVRRHPRDVSAGKRGDWWRATGRDGGWLMPDWPAVAEEWDGVHLTIAGYLTTAGRALDVDSGFATVLGGWDPDATFWFDDVLELTGEPSAWSREDGSSRWALLRG